MGASRPTREDDLEIMEDGRAKAEAWWRTSIVEMQPGIIRYRGYAIEDLIGQVSFSGMIWLMLRGDLPSEGQAKLLDTALMSAVDHGPQAPSIAIARMAMSCGVGLNNAMASAVRASCEWKSVIGCSRFDDSKELATEEGTPYLLASRSASFAVCTDSSDCGCMAQSSCPVAACWAACRGSAGAS
jgi:citrate synthase